MAEKITDLTKMLKEATKKVELARKTEKDPFLESGGRLMPTLPTWQTRQSAPPKTSKSVWVPIAPIKLSWSVSGCLKKLPARAEAERGRRGGTT